MMSRAERVARRIAYNIRAELVCCNAYSRWYQDPDEAEERGHGLCYWGEAAARLAEDCATTRALDVAGQCRTSCPLCTMPCHGGHAGFPDHHWCTDLHTWDDDGALLGYLVRLRTRQERESEYGSNSNGNLSIDDLWRS